MLQLRTDCAELLKKIDKRSDDTVTCVFGDHIQFEQLDKTQLLPRDLMRIVHNYFDDKMIVECVSRKSHHGTYILFNINDNCNRVTYQYCIVSEMLSVHDDNFDQKDDSIIIISSPFIFFNLSRLYYHYAINNNFSFSTKYNDSYVVINNNGYTIKYEDAIYESVIRNHEILQRRIAVMTQLIDIIKKL